MIAFEILVNGQRVCVAGASAVVGQTLSWTPNMKNNARLSVGGIDKREAGDDMVSWPVPSIVVGDEITIRVIETDAVDEPTRTPRPALSPTP